MYIKCVNGCESGKERTIGCTAVLFFIVEFISCFLPALCSVLSLSPLPPTTAGVGKENVQYSQSQESVYRIQQFCIFSRLNLFLLF